MSRIYAPNEEHVCDWAQVPFVHGVAAVDADEDTTHFAADGYTIDTSKHALELWDGFTVAQLDAFYTYLGGTVVAEDTKYQKVRKVEAALSALLIATLTTASAAATNTTGATKITITSPGDATYFFKSAESTSPDILYGDVPDDTWTELEAGVADDLTPTGGLEGSDDKYTVVRVTAGGTVDAIDKDTLTVKTE
jgi:hypothetical protein